jgi:glycosyltransferase involved in cell wall biosynthesis
MVVVHLTASQFYGGPERQILGLARALPPECRTVIASFAEGGRCRAFLDEVQRHGIEAVTIEHDTPRLLAAVNELAALLRRTEARLLLCHGYKANLLGRWAGRRVGIPVVAVARGWTGESLRVRLYEALDRMGLRWMDRVVCVSHAQALKVRRAGTPAERTCVIHNSVRLDRFAQPDPAGRALLHGYFRKVPRLIVGAAGRLSPEKGFQVLLPAAARIVGNDPSVGFVIFGEGALRARLASWIGEHGLHDRIVLAGFRDDLDRLLPWFDLLVLPSFTEGLPNVVLEAMAARVPVVATAAGGTPELVEDGVTGCVTPVGDSESLAAAIAAVLATEGRRRQMGSRGRERVEALFSFASQCRQYRALFEQLGEVGTEKRSCCLEGVN